MAFLVRIKNPKFSGYYFYVNTKILGDFQICISVPFNRKLHFLCNEMLFVRPLAKYSEQLFGVIKAIEEVLRTANRFKQTVCHFFFSLMITQRRSCKITLLPHVARIKSLLFTFLFWSISVQFFISIHSGGIKMENNFEMAKSKVKKYELTEIMTEIVL